MLWCVFIMMSCVSLRNWFVVLCRLVGLLGDEGMLWCCVIGFM